MKSRKVLKHNTLIQEVLSQSKVVFYNFQLINYIVTYS